MEEREKIIKLLIEVNNDITKITELEKYDSQKIVDIALEEKLYDPLLIIFKPITINGITKIYFDPFSTDLLDRVMYTYDTKEQAEKDAKEEFEYNQAKKETRPKEYELFFDDDETYEEILASKTVIPKEFKEALRKSLFSIDMDLIGKIKIKDSHARQISGIAHQIKSIEDVIFYAEPACIKACIELFNKNILTTMNDTDGVIEDGENLNEKCFITCDYTSLSQENKEIFEELIKSGVSRRFIDRGIDSISIEVPCSREETVGEISNKLEAIVSKLKMQDCIYKSQTLENFYEEDFEYFARAYPSLYQKYFDKDEYTWDDVIMFAEEIGFFYDPEEDLLWKDKYYYERHKKYQDSMPSQSGR